MAYEFPNRESRPPKPGDPQPAIGSDPGHKSGGVRGPSSRGGKRKKKPGKKRGNKR